MDNAGLDDYQAHRRSLAVQWLTCLFPDLNLTSDASEEDLRAVLLDGTVFCRILHRVDPSFTQQQNGDGDGCSAEQQSQNLEQFLSVIAELGLPEFQPSGLQQGSMSEVIECLLSLKDHFNMSNGEAGIHHRILHPSGQNTSRKKWTTMDAQRWEDMPDNLGNNIQNVDKPPETVLDLQQSPPVSADPTSELNQAGEKLYEVLQQLKLGNFSDLSPAEISDMMKAHSLDKASTLSLFSFLKRILDEIAEKNGEIPHRIAYLLKNIVQEIEQRFSDQIDHIQKLASLFKNREAKYQLKVKALETLANGTDEEYQVARSQLENVKSEKLKLEDMQRHEEEDIAKLMKEKEVSNLKIAELHTTMDLMCQSHERLYSELHAQSKQLKTELERKIKESEANLFESKKMIQIMEAMSDRKDQTWNRKESTYLNFLCTQSETLGGLRMVSDSMRKDMVKLQKIWQQEFIQLGRNLKGLTDAAENYHTILEENRKLYNEVQELKGNIRVYCRIRPFLPGQNGKTTTIDFIGENGELLISNPSKQGKEGRRAFKFNKVFGPAASQEEVFLDTQPLIRSVLDGYNVCIFAYGQTGSGKTYTMSGPNMSSKEDWGVNYRALNDLFHLSRTRRNTFMYEVGVQMVEIYNEQVRDLLSNGSVQKRLGIWSTSQPNGLAVPDASMHPVKSTSDVLELMQIGQMNRAVGATALNERSSRSHSILTVHVRGADLESGTSLRGCLHLVDLAGSERVERSEATGDRLREAQHINRSLSSLGDVIFALAQKSPHVPYRNSKLTQILQSSLGGQAKTLMFVQINPDVESYSETVSTLKFAERVSGVELGSAKVNKEGKDVRDLMDQVAYLKDALARKDGEIERLQRIKDTKAPHLSLNGKKLASPKGHYRSSLGRQPSSATSKPRRSLSVGKSNGFIDKAASDPEICSELSDKHSEASSFQSMDDFRQQREAFGQTAEGDTGDVDLLQFGDGDSEERLSDISDSVLSMGTETEGSVGSLVEDTLFPEVSNPENDTKANIEKSASRVPKPPSPLHKSRLSTAGQSRTKESQKTPSSSRIPKSASTNRLSKRWQ